MGTRERGGDHDAFRFGRYTVERYQSADVAAASLLSQPSSGEGVLPHRLDWIAHRRTWWLVVRDEDRRCLATFGVTVLPSRALPGHRSLRVERLRFAPDPGPAEAAVQCLAHLARRDARILGVTLGVFFADAQERDAGLAVAQRAGFAPVRVPQMYTHTVRIELAQEPEAILMGLHATTRRHIRAIGKHPVRLMLVSDATLGPRINEILADTFGRTAGRALQHDWPWFVGYCAAHPDQARLVALVRTDRTGPDALIAFALGLNHGDHVEYAVAGSVRPTDLHMPLAYALVWDLLVWARSIGATWFDFGGINVAQDACEGIHQFKLMFGTNVVEVRQEWALELRPRRAAWVRMVRRLADRVRKLTVRRSGGRPETRVTGGVAGARATVSSPTVSVVIPTYNRAGQLARALASVVPQCVQGDEVIVVDDGSTDDTEAVVLAQGPLVRYVRTPHLGAGAARNAGVRVARGDLVAFLDSDDEWVPGKLGWQRQVLAQRPDLLFVFSDFGCAMRSGERLAHRIPTWHRDPRPWDEILGPGVPSSALAGLPAGAPAFRLFVGDLYATYLRHWGVFVATLLVRRERAGDALHFAEDVPILEDVECFARLAARGPAGYMDCDTAWQYEHAGPRVSDADAVLRARTALTVLARVYGDDPAFLDTHRADYEAAMDAHRAAVVRSLLADGRAGAARDELARMFHPRPALSLLSGLPGAVLPAFRAARRQLRRVFPSRPQ